MRMVSQAISFGCANLFCYCFPAKHFWNSLFTYAGTLSRTKTINVCLETGENWPICTATSNLTKTACMWTRLWKGHRNKTLQGAARIHGATSGFGEKTQLKVMPSRRKSRTTGEAAMKQAPGSDEDQVRVCAAMLPAAELQADPIGKLRTTGPGC